MTDISANQISTSQIPTSQILWKPSSERLETANITRFMRYLQSERGVDVPDYPALYEWSVQQTQEFWISVWEFCGIRAHGEMVPVVINENKMPGAQWFPNIRLNFAQNLLRFKDERTAMVGIDELGIRKSTSYGELHEAVTRLAAKLRELGIGPNDVVAALMPNVPETLIAMLASVSLGAVWTSCSPDFGVQGVLDRFGQVQPKLLITTDGYRYGGKTFDSLSKVAAILPQLPSVQHVIVAAHVLPQAQINLDVLGAKAGVAMHFTDATIAGVALQFADMPFNHPLYILYSSGTTGVPKCIVHGAGGTLIQHLKELVLHSDVRREDTLMYYTTCGWMMWNWMASTLAVGATLVLFDGSPSYPTPEVLWNIVDTENVSVFGTSAKWISASEKADIKPMQTHKLKALRTILSTGSPLGDESFDYIYANVKARVLLASISGGTDIVSCFALGCPILPVIKGELQCRGLGMRVEILDDDGSPVRQQQGELACTRAFPAMPVAFFNDADGSKYRTAYFDKFPNIWCHGDLATLTASGGIVIHGRSDATLNPGGVRIGTAEIYRQVEKLPEVLESMAVGQDWDNDVRVILFVRLREGVQLDDAMTAKIKSTIRANTTPRHVPAKIIAVPDLPRTMSGKITELAVRNVIHNRLVKNTEALANPNSLAFFKDLAELGI